MDGGDRPWSSGFLGLWAAVLLRLWRTEGISPSPVNADAVNDALLPLLAVIPPQQAARLALAAAEAVDREVEAFPEWWVDQVAASASSFRLRRATHHEEHLDQIERALGPSAGGT